MIAFYVASDEYGFLCNFSTHGFSLNDRYWPTVEHYFQAQKFAGTEQEENIRLARTPKEAKNLGHSRTHKLRPDWEEVKVDIMRRAVAAKFLAHPEIHEKLISTGKEELVENSPTRLFLGMRGTWNRQKHARQDFDGGSLNHKASNRLERPFKPRPSNPGHQIQAIKSKPSNPSHQIQARNIAKAIQNQPKLEQSPIHV